MVMKRLIALLFGSLFASGCQGSADAPKVSMAAEWQVGGIYSIASGNGSFGVVKILALEPEIVHVRVYKNKFSSRPETIDLASLSLGSMLDGGDFGMGHLPIGSKSFGEWAPVLVAKTSVADDELEGYNLWKEAGGGVF